MLFCNSRILVFSIAVSSYYLQFIHLQVPPFPPPSISPLVSQAASPNQSRSTSPHRTQMSIRPPPPQVLQQPPTGPLPNVPLNGPPPPMDIMPVSVQPQLPLDQLSQSSLPVYSNPDLKLGEEDLAKVFTCRSFCLMS